MPEADEQRTPPSRWLAKWVSEERFWQDITTRTISALVVVFLGYVYALLAGYVGAPNILRAAVSLLFLIGIALAMAGYLWLQVRAASRLRRKVSRVSRAKQDRRIGAILVAEFVVLTLVTFGVALGISWLFRLIWG